MALSGVRGSFCAMCGPTLVLKADRLRGKTSSRPKGTIWINMAFSVIPIWWGLKIPCSVYFRTTHWYLVDIYRGKEIGLMSYWYLPGGLEEMSRSTTFTRASFGIGDRSIYRGCLISYTIRLLGPWGLDGFIWTVYCLMMFWNMSFIVPYIGNVIIPTDELILFRGVETTNQLLLDDGWWWIAWGFLQITLYIADFLFGLNNIYVLFFSLLLLLFLYCIYVQPCNHIHIC